MTTPVIIGDATLPDKKLAAQRPRVGEPITYRGEITGKVLRVEGALCWNDYNGQRDPLPFIWCFVDTLNTMHDWPSKSPVGAVA
jgi:hypothetical protein